MSPKRASVRGATYCNETFIHTLQQMLRYEILASLISWNEAFCWAPPFAVRSPNCCAGGAIRSPDHEPSLGHSTPSSEGQLFSMRLDRIYSWNMEGAGRANFLFIRASSKLIQNYETQKAQHHLFHNNDIKRRRRYL